MALTFYYGSGSPYSWRVFLALEHKRIPYELKVLSFSQGEHRKPEFLAINPRHQVPAITDGDLALFESAAIVEYLDERYGERSLFPNEVALRALARRLICEVDAYVMPLGEIFVQELFYKSQPEAADDARLSRGKAALVEELERFEAYLVGEWFVGAPTAVDYALYPALAMFPRYEKRYPGLGLSERVPTKLKAWMKRVEALPFFETTYPPHWR